MSGRDMLTKVRDEQHGFFTEGDLRVLAADDATRFTRCLIRCGGGRFMASAQDVEHFVWIITREGSDYVRDISLLAEPR